MFAPCVVTSMACRSRFSEAVRVESVVESQEVASSMFVEYCAFARCCARTRMAAAVPAGSSDGFVIAAPDAACCCSFESRAFVVAMSPAEP